MQSHFAPLLRVGLSTNAVALLLLAASILFFAAAQPAHGGLILDVEADTTIRTDLDIRRNDNYGKSNTIKVGSSRGGGGIAFGGPDAIRSLLRFDLSGSTRKARQAVLELTISRASPSRIFEIGVYEVLEPWIEGNGCEGPFSTTTGCPADAVWVDPANGVAWDDSDANNQAQPSFDSTIIISTTIDTSILQFGDVVQLDITPLYNLWIAGTANEGLLLRDVTSDGTFREIDFGAREDSTATTGNPAPNAPAARLVIAAIPEPSSVVLLALGLAILSIAGWRQKAAH